MATQTFFSSIPLLTFWPLHSPCLICCCLATSIFPLYCFSFGCQTGLQVFYMTPGLIFWFIVVSSVFHLFSFLDGSSLLAPMPTKFHHCLQAWIHSTLAMPGSRPLPFILEVLCIVVSTQNTLSSFIRIIVG